MSHLPPSRRPSGGRGVAPLVVLAAIVALAVMAGALWWRPAARWAGLDVPAAPSQGTSSRVVPPVATPTPAPSSAPPSAGLVPSAAPVRATAPLTPQQVASRLRGVRRAGTGTTSGQVLDAATGQVLWSSNATRQMVPASTLKLLTCAAALDALGPDARFTTRVVQGAAGQVVLVGGGDPYLSSKPATEYPFAASSATLAAQAARTLRAQGVRSIRLGYDDSLFTGPAWHPAWPVGYRDQVTTVSSLWIDQGRPDATSAPTTTPALTAATVFAAQLRAQGISVTGTPVRTRAASGAKALASVRSLPVRTLVAETLQHSDNPAAEVLLRQVGVATGHGGSFAGGVRGVRQQLAARGAWSPATAMVDGSGLARSNHVDAATLARLLQRADGDPRLSPLLEGLPTAAVSGTLVSRFANPEAAAGRGWVTAKTGTLTKVSSLAGTTVTRSGHELVFVFMSNNPQQEWNVRTWLDDMAAALTAA